MKLFDFIFETMRKRANCIDNKTYWLPKVLHDIRSEGKPLLPLSGESWNLGYIEGDEGQTIALAIVGAAGSLFDDKNVAPDTEGHPYPHLSIKSATINGLNNICVLPETGTHSGSRGYTTRIGLKFNRYETSEPVSGILLAPLCIEGIYLLEQNLILTDINDPSAAPELYVVKGTGTFKSTITGCVLNSDVSISTDGSGPKRNLALTINRLNLVDATDQTVKVKTVVSSINAEPGYEEIWKKASEEALNDDSASAAMIMNANNVLNQPENLGSLEQTMNSQLNNSMDTLFGSVSSNGLPDDTGQKFENPADLYLFDRIRLALNNRNCNFYIPRQLIATTSPCLEPYAIGKIELGKQTIKGLTWNPNVLSEISIKGLSNNMAPANLMVMKDGVLDMETNQGALKNTDDRRSVDGKEIPAPPLTVSGRFSLHPPCMDAITGSFTVRVKTSHLKIRTGAGGASVDDMIIDVRCLALGFDLADMTIDFTFDKSSSLAGFAKELANRDEVKQIILDKINSEIANNLPTISDAVSNELKNYAQSVLGASTGSCMNG